MKHHLHVQYAYSTAMLSIHTTLAYPWTRASFGAHVQDRHGTAIEQSVRAAMNASRTAILLTEHIRFDAQTFVR